MATKSKSGDDHVEMGGDAVVADVVAVVVVVVVVVVGGVEGVGDVGRRDAAKGDAVEGGDADAMWNGSSSWRMLEIPARISAKEESCFRSPQRQIV